MTRYNKGLLIALGIGDGYVFARKHKKWNYTQYGISFIHCKKQHEYIKYKAKILHSIFGGKEPIPKLFNNSGYLGYRVQKSDKYLRIIRKLLYKNNKKYITRECLDFLTPQGIAIWYMDDGSLVAHKRNGKIHAYEVLLNTYMSHEEHKIIIEYFKEVWDVQFAEVKNKNGYRLRCGTIEGRKFISIIDKYVIPIMQYKTNISKKNI